MKKGSGCIAGISDLHYLFGGKLWCIELKLPGKKQSPDQKVYQRTVEKQGISYSVVYTLQEFKKLIHEINETHKAA